MNKYCLVAINGPVYPYLFTYQQNINVQIGQIVKVPFGRRQEKGIIWKNNLTYDECNINEKIKVKPLSEVIFELPLPSLLLNLFEWMSRYYHYALGKVCIDSIPKIDAKPRPPKFVQGKNIAFEFDLTSNQKSIILKISEKINKGFSKHLIHGITGSGKTAIYLELIKQVTQELKKSVIFLLPEINLTPQFLQEFEKYLGVKIFLYHSGVTPGYKMGLWNYLSENKEEPLIIIGARSSIFIPIENLGLILIDEEHDPSYKQNDRCPYHARDVAIKRAALHNIPVIYGSATPSLESYHTHFNQEGNDQKTLSIKGQYQLKQRITGSGLPQIHLIDIKKDPYNSDLWPFTQQTFDAINKSLKNNEQVLVFTNKLGFARYCQCKNCGHCFDCKNCSTKLRYFKNKNLLVCQFCNYSEPLPDICPECQCMTLNNKGFGTEKVAQVLSEHFPDKSIGRFDRDEIKTFKQLEAQLKKFHNHEIDILVGTQMLSKGHNFQKVKLVIILGIDNQLNFPDFRAEEKTYQLLKQVSGRSGRFGGESHVYIQSLNTEHPLFDLIQSHDFDIFYKNEIEIRKACSFSPYTRSAIISMTYKNQNKIMEESKKLKDFLIHFQMNYYHDVTIAGPRPAFVEKKVNQYTWSFYLKSQNINQLHNLLKMIESEWKTPLHLKIDVDPDDF